MYITAISALGGATIGGLTSFLGSWLTQRTQLRFTHHAAIKAKREALHAEFVDEASRLYGDAFGHQKDDVADLAKLFALLGRVRLASPRAVVTAAERTFDTIIETYPGPNRTMHEVLDDVKKSGFSFLIEFGEACCPCRILKLEHTGDGVRPRLVWALCGRFCGLHGEPAHPSAVTSVS